MMHTKGTLTHKRWFCALIVAVMLCAAALPAAAASYGTVRNPNGGSYVNLREWGSYSAPILTRISVGATVEIVRTDGDWRLVRMGDAVGYMHSAFVSLGGSSSGATATVTVGPLNLRETASTSARVLTQLASGAQVTVLWRGDTWSQVSVNGLTGYLLNSYLSFGGGSSSGTVTTPDANATIRTKNGGRLNLRAWASNDSQVLGSYASGTRVRVLTHGASWCKVQVGGTVGYMSSAYLVFDGGTSGGSSSEKTYSAVVNNPKATQVLNLREAPSTSSRSLGQYYNGTAVTVLGMGTQWLRVRVGGVEGYMMTRYVKVNSASATPHKTVTNASSSYVNLREGPGYDYDIIRRVTRGEAASVVVPYPTWSKVIVRSGSGYQTGYMMNSFLK